MLNINVLNWVEGISNTSQGVKLARATTGYDSLLYLKICLHQ